MKKQKYIKIITKTDASNPKELSGLISNNMIVDTIIRFPVPHSDRETDKQREREGEGGGEKREREREIETDKQTDNETNKERDRQTERETQINRLRDRIFFLTLLNFHGRRVDVCTIG